MKHLEYLIVLVVVFLISACSPAAPQTKGNACQTGSNTRRGGDSINIAISGLNMENVFVDLFKAGSDGSDDPYEVWRQMPKQFIDTKDDYLDQLYLEDFDPGSYRIEYTLNNVMRSTIFTLRDGESLTIYVHCD